MIAEPIRRSRRRPSLGILAVVLVALTLAALGVFASVRALGGGCTFAGSACVRVLFLGNSYTSVNDLPATFAALARSANVPVEVGAIDPGGQTLAGHAAAPDVQAAIASRRWTAVVLQEQSEIPSVADLRDAEMLPAARTLLARIRDAGSRAYLYETWAHRDGWPDRRLDRAAMQAAIDQAYGLLASTSGATLVPVGEAWDRAGREAPGIELWQVDGSHPTTAGTYLAASVFVAALLERSPVGLTELGGLPPAQAAVLQRLASEAIP